MAMSSKSARKKMRGYGPGGRLWRKGDKEPFRKGQCVQLRGGKAKGRIDRVDRKSLMGIEVTWITSQGRYGPGSYQYRENLIKAKKCPRK